MIFYLTGSPIASPLIDRALENIANAGINGYHVILGERDTLASLSSRAQLSQRASAYFRSRAQGLTQNGRLTDVYDSLRINTSDGSTVHSGGDIPCGIFSNPDYCEKGQFVAENVTDAEVMVGLAETAIRASGGGLVINLRILHGGGSTTGTVVTHTLSSPSGPVFCMVDSDRAFEGASVGSTALTARRATRRVRERWRVNFTMIEQRELENLVPPDLREQACVSGGAQVLAAAMALNTVPYEIGDYCCFKNGDSMCRVINDAISKKQIRLSTQLSRLRNPNSVVSPGCGTCPADNKCFPTPALGTNFLDRVAELFRDKVAVTDSESWRTELTKLVVRVIAIGAAQPPQHVF